MSYRIVLPKTFQKQMDKLPQTTRRRIAARIKALGEDPRPPGCLKLKGYDVRYRIRVGDYRVLYDVFDDQLVVYFVKVGHRKDIYD